MPLDIEPVTRTEANPLLYGDAGDILKRAKEGEPLTGRLCHFDTCAVRVAAKAGR